MTDRISNIPDRNLAHHSDTIDAGQPMPIDQQLPRPETNGKSIPADSDPKEVQLDFNSALVIVDTPVAPNESEVLPALLNNEHLSWRKTAALLLAVLLIGGLGFVGIRNLSAKSGVTKEKLDKKQKVTPVLVAIATQRTVPVQIQSIGTVQSGMTVSVTPQVGGRINGVFSKKARKLKKDSSSLPSINNLKLRLFNRLRG